MVTLLFDSKEEKQSYVHMIFYFIALLDRDAVNHIRHAVFESRPFTQYPRPAIKQSTTQRLYSLIV